MSDCPLNPRSILLPVVLCLFGGAGHAAEEPAPGTSPEASLEKALDREVSFSFFEAPLEDALPLLAYKVGISIVLDRGALKKAGRDPKMPITRKFTDVALGKALDRMLGERRLRWTIRHGAVLVTTPEQLLPVWSLRVYPVGDLAGSNQAQSELRSLVEAIRGCVKPDSWRQAGGEASIATVRLPQDKALVVRQTVRGHRQVAELLAKLRRAVRPEKGEPPGAVPPEEKIAKALAGPVDFDFRETPLEQVVEILGRKHGIAVRLDVAALADAGIKPDVPVSIRLSGISLRSALRRLLGRLDLAHVIQDSAVVITTYEATPEEHGWSLLLVRVYPVGDLAAPGGADVAGELRLLHDLVTSLCYPTAWAEVGGPGAVFTLSLGRANVLLVSQTYDVHEEIADLLAAIRLVVSAAAEGKIAEPSPVGPLVSGAERHVLKALAQPFSCDFQKTPLADVAAFISKKTGVNVVLDRRGLDDVGLGPDTPVTLRLSGITLRSVLRWMPRSLDLTFVIQDECLLITTPEQAEERLTTAVFAVPDLVTFHNAAGKATCDFAPLVDMVTSTMKPATWDDVGGPGLIMGCTLGKARFVAVWQTRDVLEEIVDLLGVLRQLARQRAAGKIPEAVMIRDPRERTPAVEAIRKALGSKFSFQFVEKPLEDVAAEMGKKAGINVLLDRKSLDDVGIGADVPITKTASDMTLRHFLRLVLRELDLSYVIQDEVLLITTPEMSEWRLLVGLYPVPDLAAVRDGSGNVRYEYDALIDLIRYMVKLSTWDEVGGPGSIAVAPFENVDALVIAQTPDVHEEIAELLAVLRKVARLTAENPAIGARQPVFLLSREDSPRMAAIRQALGTKATLRLDKQPLAEVVRGLKEAYKIEIQVDKRALGDVGLDSRTPMSIDVKDISLGSALRLVLRPPDLTYVVVDEVLLITTPEMAESTFATRIYPVGDLVARRDEAGNVEHDFDPLMDAITGTIIPESWDKVGGPGSIVRWSQGGVRALVVSQTQEVHEEIVELLAKVRKHVRRSSGQQVAGSGQWSVVSTGYSVFRTQHPDTVAARLRAGSRGTESQGLFASPFDRR